MRSPCRVWYFPLRSYLSRRAFRSRSSRVGGALVLHRRGHVEIRARVQRRLAIARRVGIARDQQRRGLARDPERRSRRARRGSRADRERLGRLDHAR
jgi:hypothetical protein